MLRSSKIKLVCLLLCTILLSGCEATYTITINKDTIDEKIEVLDRVGSNRTVTDIMDNYKKKYPVYNVDGVIDEDDLYTTHENADYYKQTYNINNSNYNLFYEYTYPINKYKSANSINYYYDYKDISYENNVLKLSTGSPNNRLKYDSLFTNLTVNIITDYVVTNNNADSVVGNRYMWYFNKNNNNEKRINFEVDLTQTQQELKENTKIQNKKKKLIIPIVLLVVFIYIVAIIIIICKKRTKEV